MSPPSSRTRLLFVCTANQQRSPTAEHLFRDSRRVEARSCGISVFAENPVNPDLIDWADVIYCMEEHHRDYLIQRFPAATGKDIRVLDILDRYGRDDVQLILLLRNKLRSWLD